MHFSTALIAMVATTLANPVPSDLVRRDEIKGGPCKDNKNRWCPEKKGKDDKVKILVSDKTMSFGTLTAWEIMDSVMKYCDRGASCSKNDWELDSTFYNTKTKEFPTKGKIKVEIQYVGTTSSNWPADKVVKAMREGLSRTSVRKEHEYTVDEASLGSQNLGGSRKKTEKIDVNTGPTSIVLEAPNGDGVPVSLTVTLEARDVGGEQDSAACEKIVGGVGLFAGAINGWLGAGMGLAEFGCELVK